MSIPTPHITAKEGDFASTVLMPGDPKRARFIATTFFNNPELVNDVRGVQGYTGTYKGKRISVMASGMGMPSIGIYSFELFNFYGVETIIRVGSAGATDIRLDLGDIVIGERAVTKSSFAENFGLGRDFDAKASIELVKRAENSAKELQIKTFTGNIFSSDVFYGEEGMEDYFEKNNILAVEMEAAALYMNAFKAKKKALTLCTISDSLITKKSMSAKDRQDSFSLMIELALSLNL